ncbi:LuxR family transcriptional regulator [Aliikangiella sp. G2MR2-5]|uniref:helix-turn-helix transcriptional regulator n=1 Tax=Aliikangiella sp. G2MR2-5 TaxID=2788943 RepID=UPI0018A8C308|nr:LuxR family transcriptional regulator [Aliikangiella sp. G2MR2-5]
MIDFSLNYLNRLRLSIIAIVIVALAAVLDIYDDLIEGSSLSHIIEESFMVFFFLAVIVFLIRKLVLSVQNIQSLKVELENIKQLNHKQSEIMKQARAGYSEVIRSQFKEWGLTKSEVETGFLLLKGLSLKEVAAVREVKEKTTRQQASNIYQKAGVAGRHEFAGWFLEDR